MDPRMLMAAMQHAQQGQPDQGEPGEGDWLVNAINETHRGMVEETDPQIVSLLGAILNQLTTVQAKKAPQGQQQQSG